jgi:hypothetical protein
MAEGFDLLRYTPVDRDQHGVHRTFAHNPHSIRDRVPVDNCKATAAGGVDPRPLDR